jgi:mannose-6-phosphate isomerase-like protein (cupin superfamily)
MHDIPSPSISAKPAPRRFVLDPAAAGYTRILGGPPDSVTMRSGLVVLAPGESVGRHNTESYEEVLVVLAGSGELRFPDDGHAGTPSYPAVPLQANVVAYCPPQTEHDVTNTGSEPLRYLFIVARALPS